MSSKKIVYVIGSLDLGGTERHLSLIAPRLKALGWQPIIYCISRRGIQSEDVERQGVRVIGPPWTSRPSQSFVIRFIQLLASCFKLIRVLLRERPSIVHCFLPLAYVIGAPLAWLCRRPIVIMSRRSLNYYQARHGVLARFEHFLHHRIQVILVNSQAIFDQLVEMEGCDRDKLTVIYNGIDVDSVDRTPQSTATAFTELRGPILIIVANLIPYKGHSDLIDALAQVRDKMPDGWTLLCVGRDDGIRHELERHARRLGLAEHIRFLGERTDVAALLKRADIGILCSHEEGFSNAILEGMAAGLPIVGTEIGGNPESIIHGETGLLVPVRNPAALGAAILELASDKDARQRMGLAARKSVVQRFSIDQCVGQYDAVYRSLAQRQASEALPHTRWLQKIGSLRPSPRARYLALFLVTILSLSIAVSAVDFGAVRAAAQGLSTETLLTVGAIVLMGAILATVRFWCMASDIGHRLSLRDAMLALSVGQIAGAITVQFFGQIAVRSMLLGAERLSPSANILLATYERFVAAAVSAIFAITGAWYLFGSIALDLQTGGNDFLRILLGLISAVTGAAVLGWGHTLVRSIPGQPTGKILGSIARTVILTAAIQICTLSAYVVASRSLSLQIPPSSLWAAAAVVAFAASLPISFAGWGVRELSAVLVLGVIGIQSGPALTISIMMGLLSLLALAIIAGVALFIPRSSRPATEVLEPAKDQFDLNKLVQRGIPLVAASAVYFQIHVPVGTTLLNVNLADPVAILGGGLFVYLYILRKKVEWRLSWLYGHVLLATTAIVLGFLHGYSQFGWSDWAFNNKMLGWFVLLGYGATGALIVANNWRDLHLFLRTLVGTGIGILVLSYGLMLVNASVVQLPQGFIDIPLSGFSQNRNAFAFILVLTICGSFAMRPRGNSVVIGILFSGLWYAGSRAALGAAIVVVAIALFHRLIRAKTLAAAITTAVAIVAGIAFAPPVIQWLSALNAGSTAPTFSLMPTWSLPLSPTSSDSERFLSLTKGFTLFLTHPIVGAGLGAYLNAWGNVAQPVIIHSTSIWLLAELGIVGFLIFAVPATKLLFGEWARPADDIVAKFIVLILIAFAIMSSVHELLYQRPLWLLLGAALAYPAVLAPRFQRQSTQESE